MGKRIVVAGNATIDVIVDEHYDVDEGRTAVTISNEETGVQETVEVMDPPIVPGGKFRIDHPLGGLSRPFWTRDTAGGGGVNSVLAIRQEKGLSGELELSYVDMSQTDPLVVRRLRENTVQEYFMNKREIPINLVIGTGREDKIILKGPSLRREQLLPYEQDELEQRLRGSDGLLINSVKDPTFAEALINHMNRHDVPGYFVVTTSLPLDFALKHMIPSGFCIFNYDELPLLFGEGRQLSEDERLSYAREKVEELAPHFNGRPCYVTLGKHGVYCYVDREFYQIKLTPDLGEEVTKSIKKKPGSTLGAGDVFAGAIIGYKTTRPAWNEQTHAKYASQAALRHIGYQGPLTEESFDIHPIPCKQKTYVTR